MKYYRVIILFFVLSLVCVSVKVKAELPLTGKIIVIDPGHGDKDPGTSFGKIYEKDLNLSISLYLVEELTKLGAKVIMTRNGDFDLSSPNVSYRKKSDFDNRIRIINDSNANMYLSIHLNYLSNASYYGPQVFYDKENENLAKMVQNIMNEDLNGKRKYKKIPNNTYMYSKLKPEGILIECGFLSNKRERELLSTEKYHQKIAKSIARAIKMYY